MSKKKEHSKLVPELRFPEFHNKGEWEEKELIDACDMQAGNFVKASEINEQNSDGLFPCYGGNGLRGYTKSFTHEGSYPLIGRQGALCGNVTFVTSKFHATEHAVAATPSKNIDTKWLFYLLVHANLNQYATGQAQPGLSVSNLKKVQISIPKKIEEQQKIANTLTSIDDLIGAENEKLDALKAHKKGLLQQLFPAKGEQVPRVRFGEFEGDWEEKSLEDCLDYLQPTPYLVKNTDYNDSYTTPVLTAGKTFILGYTNEKEGIFNKNLPVIIFDDFTTASKFVDFPFKGKSSAMKLLLAKNNINIKFIYEAIQNIDFEVSTHKRHWISVYSKLNILVPKSNEQQKIANCLSSLDDSITAQSEKIGALQAHKKGLMQQLFPNINDVVV